MYKYCVLWANFLSLIPFLLFLSSVFIIDNNLANGVVSGKHFWFYVSMGLVVIVTFIQSFNRPNPQSFKPSTLDILVFLFVSSIFLSAWLFGDFSASSTKLTLLALLLVLYACLRITTPKSPEGDFGVYDKQVQCVTPPSGGWGVICFFIILTGLVEAVWGLMQLYGFRTSQHGLFKLTGSFFNPGPYAGYLAVVFPMALYEIKTKREELIELRVKNEELRSKIFPLLALSSSLLTLISIILVLPAAMSRAAWLAAIAGSFVVTAPHYWNKLRTKSYELKVKNFLLLVLISSLLILFTLSSFAGMYYLKKNSADGRLLT